MLYNKMHVVNYKIIIGSLAMILAAGFISTEVTARQDDSRDGISSPPARNQFQMPKLFDFFKFKELFNKHYPSLVQELARQKLFLARAFRAFVSAVGYKHHKTDHYLWVNHLSDQTPEEIAKRRGLRGTHSNEPQVVPVAERAEVERALRQMVERRDNQEPGIREAAAELIAGDRKRRSLSRERDLSLDGLMDELAKRGQEGDSAVRSVPSNNENYEPVELESFGAENEEEIEMPDAEASFISRLPGAQFVASMSQMMSSMFSSKQVESDDLYVMDADFNEVRVGSHEEVDEKIEEVEPGDEDKQQEVDDINNQVYVDHRRSRCLSQARDQGYCGSCYSFSTVALYEWAHCMESGKLVHFSEQYIVDCGALTGITGCEGGFETEVGQFVKKYGFELQKNYPYKGQQGTCPYAKETGADRMGYLKTSATGLNVIGLRLLDKLLQDTPIIIQVLAPRDFEEYGGGIHPGTNIDPEAAHSMLLVGSGKQDGQEYWLIRNSYGPKWGESGYFRLNKAATNLDRKRGWILPRTTGKLLFLQNGNYQKIAKKG